MAKRFNVKLVLEVNDVSEGKAKDFFRETVEYSDMTIEGVLFLEELLLENSKTMLELGKAVASNADGKVADNLEEAKAIVASFTKKK